MSSALEPIVQKMDLDLAKDSGVEASDLESSGEQLIWMAGNFWVRLSEARHSVLSAMLRDAGLGLLNRSSEMRRRGTTRDDIRFYAEVRDVLGHILDTIETGAYVSELERTQAAKTAPGRHAKS